MEQANLGAAAAAGLQGNTAGRDIRSEVHYHHHAAGPPAAPEEPVRFGLPAPVAHFTGREDLLAQLAATAPGAGGRAVVVLWGLGGVGKTSLAARHVADQLAGTDIAAWIRAEADPAVDLAALAERLVPLPVTATVEERARRAVEHLATCGRRWLLVFDNATGADRLRPLIPADGDGQAVVTTRSHDLHALGTMVPVGEFDTPTAAAYLEARAPHAGNGTALAEALGRLPLALSQAGSYCAGGTTFADYLEFLDELPALELFASDPEAGHERTVASTWRPSIEAAARRAPLARTILDVAAYLAPEQIPRELFEPLAGRPGTVRGRKEVADAVNALHRLSLVIVGPGGLTVHRLLQKVVRDGHAAAGDLGPARRVLDVLDGVHRYEANEPADWPALSAYAAHIPATIDSLPPLGPDDRRRQVAALNRVCRFVKASSEPEPAIAVAERVVAFAVHHLGPDAPASLDARELQALAYRMARRIDEGIAILQQVVAERPRVGPADDRGTLLSRYRLAALQHEGPRPEAALPSFEAIAADCERVLGDLDRLTIGARYMVARCHWFANRTDVAIDLLEQVIDARLAVLGPEHAETLNARYALAGAHGAAGHLDTAIALCEQVREQRRRILGPRHPDTLNTSYSLAVLYLASGRPDEAVELFDGLVGDRCDVLGPDHPFTLDTHFALGVALHAAHRTEAACAQLERATAEHARVLGPAHPLAESARRLLAVVQACSTGAGRPAEA